MITVLLEDSGIYCTIISTSIDLTFFKTEKKAVEEKGKI